MPTVKELAAQMSESFEESVRVNGEKFCKLRDGRPDWMQDICREAHGEMMPDDQRYEMIEESCRALAEHDNEDEARESIEADIYTSDLTRWLNSRADRYSYVDEYVQEYGVSEADFSLIALLQGGQLQEKIEVYDLVLSALTKLAEIEEYETEEA